MKDEEKKVNEAEEEVQTEEEGVELTDEELSSVAAGIEPHELDSLFRTSFLSCGS